MAEIIALALLGFIAALPYAVGEEFILIPNDKFELQSVSLTQINFELAAAVGAITIVLFPLYTRSNPTTPQLITLNDEKSVLDSNFNPLNPSRFIIHGFASRGDYPGNQKLRDKYLEVGDFNVFQLDWSVGADNLNYVASSYNTKEASKQIAGFIDFMNAKANMSLETVYLIGHSLGAHIAGQVGKIVKNGRINTIFGLEPALPLFDNVMQNERLSKGDAVYIEVITTGMGTFGYDRPILGNASFYVNWGNQQPKCGNNVWSSSCDHATVSEYFRESLGPKNNFYAKECKSFEEILEKYCPTDGDVSQMGGEPSNYGKNVKGVFYLPTNSEKPYAKGLWWLDK